MKNFVMFLSVVAITALAPLARADVLISIGGTTCNTTTGNPANPGGEVGVCPVVVTNGVTIVIQSTQGMQTAALSQQLTSNLSISNPVGNGTQTITIDTAANDFTTPVTPPNITDTYGFTLNENSGSITSSTYTACVDQGNSLTPGAGACGLSLALTVSGKNQVASPDASSIITSLNPSFALSQLLTLTLTAGTTLNVTETQVLTQVPEPAATLLFGTMLVGLTSLVRRRAAKRA